MKFYIDPAFVVSVTEHTIYPMRPHDGETEEDFLVRKIKYPNNMSSTSSIDHPEFAKLRNQLEAEGFIETRRYCWNGDSVLKPFYLNDVLFREGDRFYSAAAMPIRLK